MTRLTQLTPKAVERLPKQLEEGILYISQVYETAAHNCACGCGSRVVTPLTPTFWRLTLRNRKASLYPSIGNSSFACQSHYWIRDNQIEWTRPWTAAEIAAGRAADRRERLEHYAERDGWITLLFKRVRAWMRRS